MQPISDRFLIILFFLLFAGNSFSQTFHISGKVEEKFSGTALPFTHIIVNNNEVELLSDADGAFDVSHVNAITTLRFKNHLYRDFIYEVKEGEDSIQVQLQKYMLFYFEHKSSLHAERIIQNVILRSKQNDSETHAPHSYNTYNKLTVNSNRLEDAKKLFEKNLRFFGIKLKPFKRDHNLFMIESVTQKQYINDFNQRENIVASRVSGVDETSIYTISSLLLPGSIYKNYFTLATYSYLSPLNLKAFTNYDFNIVDTANINQETTYIIKFTPSRKNVDALKGLLYVNATNYAITHFIVSPAYDSPPFELAQSFVKHEGKWFPHVTRTHYLLKNYGSNNIRMYLVARTYRYNLKWENDFRVWDFDDVILKYNKAANNDNERYWDSVRREPFVEKDENTYVFYDTIGSIKKFEKYSRLGEGVYYGIIPVSKVNLEVDRFLSANEYEGLRLGAGAHTNNLLSTKYSFGGYFGYGTRDGSWKYGVNGKIVLDQNTQLTVSSSYYKDLREAAGTTFSFDRNQFSTENLRKIRLTTLDQVLVANYEASIKPIRYIYFTTALNIEDIKPTYDYQFKEEDNDKKHHFTEYKLGLKLAIGEQFIRSPQNKFMLTPKYPIVWLEYRRGLDNVLLGEYDYKKIDFKLQYSMKWPGIGKQTIQVTAGVASGNTPYFKLYNMEGSWRTFSVVVHNSFESMRYNEFLSDRYLAIHYAQDLGRKVLFQRPWIAPGLEILHSFGIGNLKNPDDHKDVKFKTMEKGYFESGVFVYDMLTLRALGIKTGLGTGVFARYGPYAHNKFIDNFVYKLGLSFTL